VDIQIIILCGVAGLLVGSFLNVVIVRLPAEDAADRSILGRSRCPACRTPIAAYDNIPVLSWLLLRGRCRACRHRIPLRYPLVEALTALAWSAAAWASPSWATVVPGIVFLTLLIPLTFIDIDHQILPNRLTYPGVLMGLALSIGLGPEPRFLSADLWWLEAIIACLAAGGLLLAAALAFPGGMGLGDVKLAAMMGAFLGAPVAIAMFSGFLLGLVPSVYLLARHGRAARKMKIPFGPFLAGGGVIGWFWGAPLLDLYLQGL
jgi:leader peptidase (prepilin peptidase)/N-methyltransferase